MWLRDLVVACDLVPAGLLVPAALFWCILSAQLNNLAQVIARY